MTLRVTIPNLAELQKAIADYPAISRPIIQNAIVAAQAILSKFTIPGIVPVRTGYLVQNWGMDIGDLQARWYPKAAYAGYVESGTAPHIIRAVNRRVLANAQTGQIFGPVVKHPGTAPNPFLERIVGASQTDIAELFVQAMTKITSAIAQSTNG